MNTRWLLFFWQKAKLAASMSQDQDTKVGCCIFDEDERFEVVSGYNCLPRGVHHHTERSSRPNKYDWTSHSEISAITNAARQGRPTLGKSLIVTMMPCSLCSCAIINAGIKRVYTPEPDFNHSKYGNSFAISKQMFTEAGVDLVYIDLEKQ